jgi:hypothetical protein
MDGDYLAGSMNGHRGIAVATGCRECIAAAHLARSREYEPGRYLAAIHAHHIPALQAQGWAATDLYGDGIPDIICPHIAATAGQ